MIFLTVGTDMPFNRLIRTVDQWAMENGRSDVFAQIGNTDNKPSHIEWEKFIDPAEFKRLFASADHVVAHAGMGTILTALHFGKPILVMPRRASLGEQRNEHQLATARKLSEFNKINVAFDEKELLDKLNRLDVIESQNTISPFADGVLIKALSNYINNIGI